MTVTVRPVLAAALTLACVTPALAHEAGPITAVHQPATGRYCIAGVDPSASVETIALARVGACRTEDGWRRRGIKLDTPTAAQLDAIRVGRTPMPAAAARPVAVNAG